MKTKAIVAIALIISIFLSAFSQKKADAIINSEQITIRSKILDEDRIILISLPDDFSKSDQEYPVLYLLDGKTHFRHSSSAASYLAQQGLAPDMIVVGIVNVDRNRDFTPVNDPNTPTSGGGEKFLNFLDKELIPYMEKNYRASKFNVLMGHSLGGVFCAYSLLKKPDLFDAYIAVSPYLMFADNYMVKQAKEKLKAKYAKPKSFYVTVGDEPGYLESLDEFSAQMKEKSDKSIRFQYVQMPGENHATSPYFSLYNGLRFTFPDWILPREVALQGLDAIDDHYKKISQKYDFKMEASELLINMIGYNYLQRKEIDKAIEIFKENAKRFPKSSNVWDSLGDAYENNNQLDLAKENYQKAYDLGLKEEHMATSIYKANLDRVSKK